MNKEILDKVDEIMAEIYHSPTYRQYEKLQELMKRDDTLMSLINEVRDLQRDVVRHKTSPLKLEEKQALLLDYPLYREYINTISEINNTLALIEHTLNNYFDKKFN